MRVLVLFSLAALVSGAVVLTGCASKRPPPKLPAAVTQTKDKPDTPVVHIDQERPADTIPRVIRRLVAEQKELVQRSLSMANELRDAGGRERARAEATALAAELARISAPIDEADSDVLDDTVDKLQLLDTRVVLLHEKLRTATDRTTAVLIE